MFLLAQENQIRSNSLSLNWSNYSPLCDKKSQLAVNHRPAQLAIILNIAMDKIQRAKSSVAIALPSNRKS